MRSHEEGCIAPIANIRLILLTENIMQNDWIGLPVPHYIWYLYSCHIRGIEMRPKYRMYNKCSKLFPLNCILSQLPSSSGRIWEASMTRKTRALAWPSYSSPFPLYKPDQLLLAVGSTQGLYSTGRYRRRSSITSYKKKECTCIKNTTAFGAVTLRITTRRILIQYRHPPFLTQRDEERPYMIKRLWCTFFREPHVQRCVLRKNWKARLHGFPPDDNK